ncbi:MAG TPA: hypothetical protein VF690_01760, partial [Hymenobacter sp.]
MPADTTLTVELNGPGDVVGINRAAILRTIPSDEEQRFSPLQLAGVEFREEDFPWRYSPAAVNNRSRPWCFVLALEESEFRARPQGTAPLASIEVQQGNLFPEADKLWLWAHVQANQVFGTSPEEVNTFLQGLLQQNPGLAFSRVFSSRRLKPNTRYRGVLLPSFESGRLAGLGLPANRAAGSLTAWENKAAGEWIPFPIYYQWDFQTAAGSDFESLARLMQPAPELALTPRKLEVNLPLGSAAATAGSYALPMPGVLMPLEQGVTAALPPEVAGNLYQELLPGQVGSGGRPVVAPPLYGRYYVDQLSLTNPSSASTNWYNQVNLDPRYRAVASLGSQVVQDGQEEYMQRAWEQVQDVLVANLNLRGMQYGLKASTGLRDQHLPLAVDTANVAVGSNQDVASIKPEEETQRAASQDDSSGLAAAVAPAPTLANYGLQLTALALPCVRLANSGLTARETIRRSNVPLAAFSPPFRRITKPFGRFQANLAGPPLRPTQTPDAVAGESPLGPGTSLQQRDELLNKLSDGTVRGSRPKDSLFRAYQFDDVALNALLAGEAQPTELRIVDEEGQYQQITDAAVVDLFTQAFAPFRTAVRFRTVDPAQPRLDLEALKKGMVAGTDPVRVFTTRANQALQPVPRFVVGDWEPADFNGADFLLDEVIPGLTIVQPTVEPVARRETSFAANNAGDSVAADEPLRAQNSTAIGASGSDQLLATATGRPRPVQPVMAYPVFKDPM